MVEWYLSDATLLVNIGAILIGFLIEVKLVTIKTIKDTTKKGKELLNIITLDESIKELIKSDFMSYSLPDNLPMIVKPKKWGEYNQLGGFLLNGVSHIQDLIIKKPILKLKSEFSENNIIFNLINHLNSVKYKINNDVLNFILSNNNKFNFYTEDKTLHPYKSKPKLTKKEKKELKSYQSKVNLDYNIINIAIWILIYQVFIYLLE